MGTYSSETKALFAACIPMFAAGSAFSFWHAAFDSDELGQAVLKVLVGAFFAWLLTMSLKVARYLRCRILVQAEGLRLRWPSVEKSYSWPRLRAYRDRPALQLVEVYDSDGNCILLFDYHLVGFADVYASIASRLPARA